ncbi:MAG: response regulator [Nitrospiraceae bacterium]|nr:response regulator [Nitrospiraceae bacterium]
MDKILVINNEPRIFDLLATILEWSEVLPAESGRMGLDLFLRERPDLTVLDIELPDMDGITLLRNIRGIDTEMPVVIITVAGTAVTKKQARELGVTAFIDQKLLLPYLGEQVVHDVRGARPKHHPLMLMSVLLVDDHALVREALRRILEGYGDMIVVGEASNGKEAVDAVEMLLPTIVVMDISMPCMNGIEATARIKARHPRISVIGLSVTTEPDHHTAMMAAGATALIPKEAACDRLHSAIKQAVQGKRSIRFPSIATPGTGLDLVSN